MVNLELQNLFRKGGFSRLGHLGFALILVGMPVSAASLNGLVVDHASRVPLAECDVWIARDRLLLGGKTAGDGSFGFSGLEPGFYSISITHRGFLMSVGTLEATLGPSNLQTTLSLTRLGAIAGHLRGLYGRTARVLALIKSESAVEEWKPVLESISICCSEVPARRGVPVGSEGEFSIDELPPGSYRLLVTYDDAFPKRAGEMSRARRGAFEYPRTDKALTLTEGGSVSIAASLPDDESRVIGGNIIGSDNESSFSITLTDSAHPFLSISTRSVGPKDRSFVFNDVAPGIYDLLLVPGDGETTTKTIDSSRRLSGFSRVQVDARTGNSTGISIRPGPTVGASVSLILSSSPKAEPGCRTVALALVPLEDWGFRLDRLEVGLTVGNRGDGNSFFIDGLEPGAYSANLVSGTCKLKGDPMIDVGLKANGQVFIESLEPGHVFGTLGNLQTSRSYEVLLTPLDLSAGWGFLPETWFRWHLPVHGSNRTRGGAFRAGALPNVFFAVVQQDGTFDLRLVPPGRYRFEVQSTAPSGQSIGRIETSVEMVEVSPSSENNLSVISKMN